MMSAIQRAGEPRQVVYDADEYRLQPKDTEAVFYLGNIYEDYCAAPEENRANMLRGFVRTWFSAPRELPDDFEDLQPDLLPALRSRSFLENAAWLARAEGHAGNVWPHQIVGEHLAVGLVYDLPEFMRSIQQEELDNWGVTFFEAMEAARQNLVEKGEVAIAALGKGTYVSATGDCYDATRMIYLDLVRRFEVDGDHIAMVPNRDWLIVTGSLDEDGLKAMLFVAEKELQKARSISGRAFRLSDDEWEPWMPGEDHPLYPRFNLLQLQSMGQDYGDQKEHLEKLHEKTGEDVFVATFNILQDKETDEVFSYAVWPNGVLTWLPKADKLAVLRSNDDKPELFDWDRVVAVAGDLMTPLEMYPIRYQVADFPGDEQLKMMSG